MDDSPIEVPREQDVKALMEDLFLTSEQAETFLDFSVYLNEKATTQHFFEFEELLTSETVELFSLSNDSIKNKIELLSIENQTNQIAISDSNRTTTIIITFLVLITIISGNIAHNHEIFFEYFRSQTFIFFPIYLFLIFIVIPLYCFNSLLESDEQSEFKRNLIKREIAYRLLEFKEKNKKSKEK